MEEKKKFALAKQNTIQELDDAQLDHVVGGLTIPAVTGSETLSGKENPFNKKLGQTMEKPTFRK